MIINRDLAFCSFLSRPIKNQLQKIQYKRSNLGEDPMSLTFSNYTLSVRINDSPG